jgi:hypothetical protein
MLALMIAGVYIGVGAIIYIGAGFFPKLHDMFDGDPPFVPLEFLSIFWPFLLPLYVLGFSMYYPAIGAKALQKHILEYTLAKQEQRKQLQEAPQAKQLSAPIIDVEIENGPVNYRHQNCKECGRLL